MRALICVCALDIKPYVLLWRYSIFPVIVLHVGSMGLIQSRGAMSAYLQCPMLLETPGLFGKIGTCRTEKEDYNIVKDLMRLEWCKLLLVRVARPESSLDLATTKAST